MEKKCFFAVQPAGHQNYARYATNYFINDMYDLPSEVRQKFHKGLHVASLQGTRLVILTGFIQIYVDRDYIHELLEFAWWTDRGYP